MLSDAAFVSLSSASLPGLQLSGLVVRMSDSSLIVHSHTSVGCIIYMAVTYFLLVQALIGKNCA